MSCRRSCIMNPMGKDHVTALLDALLALDADGVGARAAADASAALSDVPGEFKIALVVADDLMGGWTNRYDYEYTFRFGPATVISSATRIRRPVPAAPVAQAFLAHGCAAGAASLPRSVPRGRRSSCPHIG